MKLNREQINVRLPKRLIEKLRIIQSYKSRTATIIIEDALEKGLKWYLQQIAAEEGYTKENPLTWEKLAEKVKLSVITNEDNTTEEHVTDEELEKALAEIEYDEEGSSKRN